MKRAPSHRDQGRQTLAVSIFTVAACFDAARPQPGVSAPPSASLTFRGQLSSARRTKRGVLVIVRRCDMRVAGRVFPDGPLLNVLVNFPPVLFSDVLALALSGKIAAIDVTTEKLRRDIGAVFGARFATGEIRSTASDSIHLDRPRALPKSPIAKSKNR